jgi:competence protein ComEC
MRNRKLIYSILGIGLIVLFICVVILFQSFQIQNTEISFLDVGQGDAILISQGNNQILIDGGPDGTILLEKLGEKIPFWDRKIEVIIATHPDKDHIDGLIDVVKTYQVDQFWQVKNSRETDVFQALERELKLHPKIYQKNIFAGTIVNFPTGGELKIIHPFDDEIIPGSEEDANLASITATFKINQETFYLGGDLPTEREDLLPLRENEITVLKAGHHGSQTSSSEYFLQKLKPRDVIFSVGKNNRYGHPHPEILERAENVAENIFRTDENGNITYRCDEVNCEVFLEK